MKTPTEEAIEKKFDGLIKEAIRLTTPVSEGPRPLRPYVERREYQALATQATNLIEIVCGRKSAHYEAIAKCVAAEGEVDEILGVLEGARHDNADGFLAEVRLLVRADLLDNFLEQAEALEQSGYYAATASVVGAVLEDTLRKLCDKHTVPYDPVKTSIEALNVELARAGVYDKLVQKEITAKAHLRNEADHGRFANVKPRDVEDMRRWVRRFVQENLR